MKLLRRLWKRWTIRSRAHQAGCRHWGSVFPGESYWLLSIGDSLGKLKPGAFQARQKKAMRFLNRIVRIEAGLPPFEPICGRIGGAWQFTASLESAGNLVPRAKPEFPDTLSGVTDSFAYTMHDLYDHLFELMVYNSSRPECKNLRWKPYGIRAAVESLPPAKA